MCLTQGECTAIADRREGKPTRLKNDLRGGEGGELSISPLSEVSVTPGSLFQRRNYGLDRWKIAAATATRGLRRATSGSRLGSISPAPHLDARNARYKRDANARDAWQAGIGVAIRLGLAVSSPPLPLLCPVHPNRTGTCPRYFRTRAGRS